MKRISRWAIQAIGIVVIGLAVVLAWPNPLPDEIKIGVSQPLSGPFGPTGEDLLRGVQMAVDEINATGGARIGSKRIKLSVVAVDDQANPREAVAAAQKLVDAGVIAAIAHLNSGVSIPAAPVYARAGIPQFAISTKPDYTRLGLPTTLRLVANDDMQSKAMANYALKLPGAQSIALVDDGSAYGRGLAELTSQLFAAAGRTLELRRSYDDKRTDFGALVAEVKQARIDLIVAVLQDFQIIALTQAMAAAGLAHVKLLGGDAIKTDTLLRAGRSIHTVLAASPIAEPREFYAGRAFADRYRARFGSEPVYGSHYTYDAVYVLAHALAVNGSLDKTRLIERLKTFDGNAPVTTTMRFDETGEQRYGSIGIYRLDHGHGRWELEARTDRW